MCRNLPRNRLRISRASPLFLAARKKRIGQRGVTALEYALVLPLILLVLLVIIEVGIQLTLDATLERAVNQAVRKGHMATLSGANCEKSIEQAVQSSLSFWNIPASAIQVIKQAEFTTLVPDSVIATNTYYQATCPGSPANAMLLFNVSVTNTGFSGVLAWLDIKTIQLERNLLLQNEPGPTSVVAE